MTFLALAGVQSMAMASAPNDFVKCKPYTNVPRRVDLELGVECRELATAPTFVSRSDLEGCRYRP